LVDEDFILGIFDKNKNKAKILFEEFHKIEEDIECLEINDKKSAYGGCGCFFGRN
jgi:hypothetical protein